MMDETAHMEILVMHLVIDRGPRRCGRFVPIVDIVEDDAVYKAAMTHGPGQRLETARSVAPDRPLAWLICILRGRGASRERV